MSRGLILPYMHSFLKEQDSPDLLHKRTWSILNSPAPFNVLEPEMLMQEETNNSSPFQPRDVLE